jgi:hypothetical protein
MGLHDSSSMEEIGNGSVGGGALIEVRKIDAACYDGSRSEKDEGYGL